MIRIGYHATEKQGIVRAYCAEHNISRIVVISGEPFGDKFDGMSSHVEHIGFTDVVRYVVYYRLLREIDRSTLIVLNECLCLQNRYDLHYNCIRLFLNQTSHQIIFQSLPIIDTVDDFMILFDFDTRSRWKREPFRRELLSEANIAIKPWTIELREIAVATDRKTKESYARRKRELIDGIGLRDPHTIPRNLHLHAGRPKLAAVDAGQSYVGRNNRFKLPNLTTYDRKDYPEDSTVFEFCHDFITFRNFVAISRQTTIPVLVSDLKVDQWYFHRFRQWAARIHETSAILSLAQERT